MHLDTILTPPEIDRLSDRDLRGITCVVFDVLRATSSIVTGLAHGVTAVHAVETVDEALALKRELPDAILGGERQGDRIDGFDVGNSPLEYLQLAGRRVIMTTTNGTVALRACAGAAEVVVAALLNLDAVVDHLKAAGARDVLLVCAGTFRGPALEDILAAGALLEAFPGAELSDASRCARAVHQQSSGDPLAVLHASRNGAALLDKGRGAELAWCAQRSRWPLVGLMRDRAIVAVWRDGSQR